MVCKHDHLKVGGGGGSGLAAYRTRERRASDFISLPKTCIFTLLGVVSCVGRKKKRPGREEGKKGRRRGGRDGGREGGKFNEREGHRPSLCPAASCLVNIYSPLIP